MKCCDILNFYKRSDLNRLAKNKIANKLAKKDNSKQILLNQSLSCLSDNVRLTHQRLTRQG